MKLNKGYFITAADTGIGKTYVSAFLYKAVKKYEGAYYKPVQSGCIEKNGRLTAPDIEFICNFNNEEYDISKGTYFLKEEVSPHLAAEIENIEINFEKIKKYWENLKIKYKTIIVEGAGGVYVPLVRNKYFIFNLIKDLNIPVILVCSTKVGAVNHALLTIDFLKQKKIKIHGIVFNNVSENIKNFEKDNMEVILKISEIKKYLIIKENQKNISEDEILKFLEEDNE